MPRITTGGQTNPGPASLPPTRCYTSKAALCPSPWLVVTCSSRLKRPRPDTLRAFVRLPTSKVVDDGGEAEMGSNSTEACRSMLLTQSYTCATEPLPARLYSDLTFKC